jgi:hypothetical protein
LERGGSAVRATTLIHQLLSEDEQISLTLPINKWWLGWEKIKVRTLAQRFSVKIDPSIGFTPHYVADTEPIAHEFKARPSRVLAPYPYQYVVDVVDLTFTGTSRNLFRFLKLVAKSAGRYDSFDDFISFFNGYETLDGRPAIPDEVVQQWAAWEIEDVL